MIGNDTKQNTDDFLRTILSYGIVIRADLQQIQNIKQFLVDQGVVICFQKTSTNKLYIKED